MAIGARANRMEPRPEGLFPANKLRGESGEAKDEYSSLVVAQPAVLLYCVFYGLEFGDS